MDILCAWRFGGGMAGQDGQRGDAGWGRVGRAGQAQRLKGFKGAGMIGNISICWWAVLSLMRLFPKMLGFPLFGAMLDGF
jgi:hypothetical protein